MLPLDLLVDLAQVVHQLFLFALFTKHIGHLLLEGADDVGMDLWGKERWVSSLLGMHPGCPRAFKDAARYLRLIA
jgi:hypothetical protein